MSAGATISKLILDASANAKSVITAANYAAMRTLMSVYSTSEVDALIVGSGGGNVSKVGTPLNNQVGVWTGDGTIEGDPALTYDATTDTLTSVNFAGALVGNVTGNVSGSSGSCTGNAATVTTNANLTGHVTSTGNAAVLGSFTKAQLNTAVSDGDVVYLDSVDAITGVKTMSGLNVILVSSSGLTIRNPANTFKYTITAAAILADRILTLPLTAGTLALTSDITGTNSGTNTGDQNVFTTIAVSGQSNVVSDQASDTLTLVAGTNITITTDASTDSITINATGGSGGLTIGATKTASFTAVAGTLYPVDLSAATANIDVTFPSSPSAGDEFGFYVAVASTTAGGSGFAQAPYWGVEPLTGTVIDGVAFVQSTGDGVGLWGLLTVGELLVFRWDAVASTWIVDNKRKKLAFCSAYPGTADTTNTAATNKAIVLDTLVGVDAVGLLSTSAGKFQIKRSGRYTFVIAAHPNSSLADQKSYVVGAGTSSTVFFVSAGTRASTAGSTLHRIRCDGFVSLLAGDSLWAIYQSEDANKGCVNTQALVTSQIAEEY